MQAKNKEVLVEAVGELFSTQTEVTNVRRTLHGTEDTRGDSIFLIIDTFSYWLFSRSIKCYSIITNINIVKVSLPLKLLHLTNFKKQSFQTYCSNLRKREAKYGRTKELNPIRKLLFLGMRLFERNKKAVNLTRSAAP